MQITAGEILKGLHFHSDRAPLVCSALKAQKFLGENNLVLEQAEGPARMQSVRVTYTYRLNAKDESPDLAAFLRLRGAGKQVFGKLGGGETFLRKERARFYGTGAKE